MRGGYTAEPIPVAFWYVIRTMLVCGVVTGIVRAESTSSLIGTILDPSDRPVPGANILVRNLMTSADRVVITNSEGIYEVSGLPVGTYRLQVSARGFRKYTIETLTTQVARTFVQNVHLELGDVSQELTVTAQPPLVDMGTTSVGHLIDHRTVQETPLNGRYFLDLALLVPGSVTASQSGFSTVPMRGLGALAINTAGNREETVNYMINGITLNDLVFSSILFQPSVSTIQEFKIDNSTFSAEYGQSSGAVVNVATRSGTNQFHGELFEFLRNDVFDARNFFNFNSTEPPPFKRNQFGANAGGPIVMNRTFFFASYEGMRQSQQLNLNSVVLSETQRRSVTDGSAAKLVELIPRPNFVDSSGTPRFVGSAPAPVDSDQWGLDITHLFNDNDRIHGYYGIDITKGVEPTAAGTSVPGFGQTLRTRRQFFSLSETHIFSHARLNEARIGFNRLSSSSVPNSQLNPADFGIRNGITEPIGIPQINIAGALTFGGPPTLPSGRTDTTIVAADTMSCLCGRHSVKIGGEFRQFLNNNYRVGTGSFNFASLPAFLAGTANSFGVTLGRQASSIVQGAFGIFIQSNYKWRTNVTLELGLRYDWNLSPDERYDRFIVFDPHSGSLERIGQDGGKIYHQNNKNLQPRVGFAWDPFKDGKTSVRGAYAILVDQPMTSVVTGTSANPPLAVPLTYTGTIGFENAIDLAHAAGLAPATVDPGFNNAYIQSWNFNVQRELVAGLAWMAGYFGSKGTHLILRRNINQPVQGMRPYPTVSPSSPILPSAPIGNITQAESTGISSYNALWVSANKRLARRFQINASYTWSKSIDYNSLSSSGVVVQDSYNLRGDRGLSDFDARHRFALNAIYQLPFEGNRFLDNWQLAVVAQAQSGNPVNIVTANSAVTGTANTLRPNVTGSIQISGSVDRWFDTSAFAPVAQFGNLGRNVIIGPAFSNIDLSIIKDIALGESVRVQFRAEFFDVLNHANFGQPGNVVGSPNFGRITNTRFPTGESGSSRQIQFGIKALF